MRRTPLDMLREAAEAALVDYRVGLKLGSEVPVPFEFLLGRTEPKGVIVLGENPGGNPDEHQNATTALDHGISFFQRGWHYKQWDKVWSRYAWMLPSQPSTPVLFAAEASAELTVTNLWHHFGSRMPRGLRGKWTQRIVEILKPRLVVVQGAKAWDWVRNRTDALSPGPVDRTLSDIWGHGRIPSSPVRYRARWRDINVESDILPVAHLSGFYNPKVIPRATDLLPEYRAQLNLKPMAGYDYLGPTGGTKRCCLKDT